MKEKFLVRFTTSAAILFIMIGIAMPYLIYLRYSNYDDYIGLASLGPVGDFLGGSTVAFLNTGSILLLLATLFMQRKELKVSQDSIKQLVKQTNAAEVQAIEARAETKITNSTMKKQQFDTTFFNMISLHHDILREINYRDYRGRYALTEIGKNLKYIYSKKIYDSYSNELKFSVRHGNIEELNDFSSTIMLTLALKNYIRNFETYYKPDYIYDIEEIVEDNSRKTEFYRLLKVGEDNEWNEIKSKILLEFNLDLSYKAIDYDDLFKQVDFRNYIKNEELYNLQNCKVIQEFKGNFFEFPLKALKMQAYEDMYRENENNIGHYYRNLYRIIKIIDEQVFDENMDINELEKRKYRGILRAQLSSVELYMVFYNVVYSKKGKKFKDLLMNTDFFDEHLIEEGFVWKNDLEELKRLASISQ